MSAFSTRAFSVTSSRSVATRSSRPAAIVDVREHGGGLEGAAVRRIAVLTLVVRDDDELLVEEEGEAVRGPVVGRGVLDPARLERVEEGESSRISGSSATGRKPFTKGP